MGGILGGADNSERARNSAASARACDGHERGALAACCASQISDNCAVQLAACVSGVERCAAPGGDPWNGAKSWLDGGGVCAIPALYARKHRRRRDPGWARTFFGGARARKRSAVLDGTHWRLGVVLVRPCALRVSA